MNETSVFDGKAAIQEIIGLIGGNLGKMSSRDIGRAISSMIDAKREAEKREKKERAEREAREEKERHDARVAELTSMELPLDWENAFLSDTRAQGIHAESIPDGLIRSLTTLGRVDIEYIASVTGATYKDVILTLKGSIYQNPETWGECFYKGWETSEEYLSGNLLRKRRAAEAADRTYNGWFADNIRAIDRVLPEPVAAEDIYVTLGSPWVPADIIDDFINHILKLPRWNRMKGTRHDELTGTWELPYRGARMYGADEDSYGTRRISALSILERTLNMKPVSVTDRVPCPANESGEKREINREETVAALDKQGKMIREFQTWVWQDRDRKDRLERIFENRYSCVRRRVFDGSFLDFPGLSPKIRLYPYQKNAVARILFSPNTLLAHDVGAGKTYVMAAAGMELRRMGLSRKNLYVVPNNIVGQWESIFRSMYPRAKLRCVEPKDFAPRKRTEVLERIRDEDLDGIIMAYSCFESIPLSRDYYEENLHEELLRVEDLLARKGKATTRLRKKKEALEKELAETAVIPADPGYTVYFDELGITRLFVDEAHNFKNVPVETKVRNILGISSAGSRKCEDMMDKVHLVQRQNDGGGVVFATGTPITNSITDAYIMQRYLQSGELAMLDLEAFDSWVGMFAERTTEFEIDVDTSKYRMATRFARFHNLPELTSLLSSIADFHPMEGTAGIPDMDGRKDALVPKTPEFAAYLDKISERAERVRKGFVPRSEDNMLLITTDGRKGALDLRLVDPEAAFTYESKAACCAENAAAIYFRTDAEKGTQLIFCDTSTPKAGFNLYAEMKRLLVMYGVPAERIAYIHSARTEAERSKLFARVRRGDIRILIGSTFKLGLGVNVQDRMIALHHLDVPWRPADMTQREGRILRQGNRNPKVEIYRYITEGSFDAYSWQLLETKQRFITELLSGSLAERSGADVEDTVLDYAEVKALAIGDPRIKERVETANELTRLITLQKKTAETHVAMERELMELPGKIARQKKLIRKCDADREFEAAWTAGHPEPENYKEKAAEAERRRALRGELGRLLAENVLNTRETHAFDYRGFRVVIPANMTAEQPWVWLEREGRYYVSLGDTDLGYLRRIDFQLDHLEEHGSELRKGLKGLETKAKHLRASLASPESYAAQIEECCRRLEELDKELGVEKDE